MRSPKRIRLDHEKGWNIEAIVADSLSAPSVPCLRATVGLVKNKKKLSRILQHIGEKYPIRENDNAYAKIASKGVPCHKADLVPIYRLQRYFRTHRSY